MAQDYLRQSQPRRGTGGSTLAHRTSNLSDTEAQCLGLLNRSDPALSSTEARTIPAQTLDLIPISNTSIGNSRFSRCRSRTHVNDCQNTHLAHAQCSDTTCVLSRTHSDLAGARSRSIHTYEYASRI